MNGQVYVAPGLLRPPKDTTAPMLMVGLGTGIAPMRALLRERIMVGYFSAIHICVARSFFLEDKRAGKPVGPATLYQACRHREKVRHPPCGSH